MNRIVFGALAFTAASSLAFAGSESSDTDSWLSLDREIESLASNVSATAAGGLNMSAFLRSNLAFSSDIDPVPGATSEDLGGFTLMNARVIGEGSVGSFGVYIGLETANIANTGTAGTPVGNTSILGQINSGIPAAGGGGVKMPGGAGTGGDGFIGDAGTPGNAALIDAYIDYPIGNDVSLRAGLFRAPMLQNGLYDSDRLAFGYRTFAGSIFDARDLGVQFSGAFDRLMWWVSAQNGIDGAGDEFIFTLRAAYAVMGMAGLQETEGAHGKPQGDNLVVAASWTEDDDNAFGNDRTAFVVEAHYSNGQFSGAVEVANLEEGWFNSILADEITPVSVQGTYNVNSTNEVGVRFTDLDDDDDTTALGFVWNNFHMGHAARWQAGYVMTESDIDSLEYDIFYVGFIVGVGR